MKTAIGMSLMMMIASGCGVTKTALTDDSSNSPSAPTVLQGASKTAPAGEKTLEATVSPVSVSYDGRFREVRKDMLENNLEGLREVITNTSNQPIRVTIQSPSMQGLYYNSVFLVDEGRIQGRIRRVAVRGAKVSKILLEDEIGRIQLGSDNSFELEPNHSVTLSYRFGFMRTVSQCDGEFKTLADVVVTGSLARRIVITSTDVDLRTQKDVSADQLKVIDEKMSPVNFGDYDAASRHPSLEGVGGLKDAIDCIF